MKPQQVPIPVPPAVPLLPPSRLVPDVLGIGPLLCLFMGASLMCAVLVRAAGGPLVPIGALGALLVLCLRPLLERMAAARLGPRGPVSAWLTLCSFAPLLAWLALWALALPVPMGRSHRDRYMEEIFIAGGLGLVIFLVAAGNAGGLLTRHLLLRRLPSRRLLGGLTAAALLFSLALIGVACVRAAHLPDPDRFVSMRGSVLRVLGDGETVPFSALGAARLLAPPLGWILVAAAGVVLALFALWRQRPLRALGAGHATWLAGTLTPEARIFFAGAAPPCAAPAGSRLPPGPVVVVPLSRGTLPTYREQGGLGPIQVIAGTPEGLAERLSAALCAGYAYALAALCLTLSPLLVATILLH